MRAQNPNGSWPAFDGDDSEGTWVTSLAAIALRDYVPAIPSRLRGFHWLVNCAGKEAHWLWKSKFRTSDRHVRFDPDKYGWPWVPDTVSWVVPTSFAILALRQLPCRCRDFGRIQERVDLGTEMLIDRGCPGGGWNAGNGVVYGVPLPPHADDSSVALLALCRKEHTHVKASVRWLKSRADKLRSSWSLAWSVLALAAHGESVDSLLVLLATVTDRFSLEDTSTLACVTLAADYRRAVMLFGVTQ